MHTALEGSFGMTAHVCVVLINQLGKDLVVHMIGKGKLGVLKIPLHRLRFAQVVENLAFATSMAVSYQCKCPIVFLRW